MNLFVIRHAKAIDPGEPMEDGLRPLTARGRRDALAVGQALREAEVALDAIVTSPLVRAVETAELIAVGLDWAGALDVAIELGIGRHPQAVVEEVLLPRADLAAVAIVGHEPQLGALIGALLHSQAPSPAKASVTRLSWDGPERAARFKWVLRPGMTRPSKDIADLG